MFYYGDTVYYENNQVYYGDQPVATAEEYAQQAEQIATSAPETADETAEWMPLGIFAVTGDSESSSAEPTIYLQLAVNKDGVIAGAGYNSATDKTVDIDGMVDKETQRAAWVVSGTTSPVMETGIANLTEDEAPALLHRSADKTERVLLIRLEEPDATDASQAAPDGSQ